MVPNDKLWTLMPDNNQQRSHSVDPDRFEPAAFYPEKSTCAIHADRNVGVVSTTCYSPMLLPVSDHKRSAVQVGKSKYWTNSRSTGTIVAQDRTHVAVLTCGHINHINMKTIAQRLVDDPDLNTDERYIDVASGKGDRSRQYRWGMDIAQYALEHGNQGDGRIAFCITPQLADALQLNKSDVNNMMWRAESFFVPPRARMCFDDRFVCRDMPRICE